MLTLDLLRYRVTGNDVSPVFLSIRGSKRYRTVAEQLIEIHKLCVGRTIGELEDQIEEALGSMPEHRVYRGLAKILEEYAVVEQPSEDAEELRRAVFTMAGKGGRPVWKSDLVYTTTTAHRLKEIASTLGVSHKDLPDMLYADLKDRRLVREFDSSIGPDELMERYNTALAQAMLYRATRVAVDVYDSYRTVFKYIKLARLMHSVRPHEGGYRIFLDGPMSLFAQIERYGIAMARFLPAVLKCEKWRLTAKVRVGSEERFFRLDPRQGLKSHYRDEPVFDSSPEEAFFNKFSRNTKSKWTIEREGSILDLKDTVLIPDFKFTHKDGRVAHLEIVGFWTPDYLNRKLEKLGRIEETNVVIAVPEVRNCSSEVFNGPVVRYKGRLLIKDVLPALEAAAR